MKTPMPTSACGRGALVFESLREFWATAPLGSAKSLEHQSSGVEHSRTGSLGCEVSIGYGVVVLGNPCRELQAGIGLTLQRFPSLLNCVASVIFGRECEREDGGVPWRRGVGG